MTFWSAYNSTPNRNHVVGAARELNCLEMVGETVPHALNGLAVVTPDWTQIHSQAEWLRRYGSRVQNYRLPKSLARRDKYTEQIDADDLSLLIVIFEPGSPKWLIEIPTVRILRRVWIHTSTTAKMRTSSGISSPFNPRG